MNTCFKILISNLFPLKFIFNNCYLINVYNFAISYKNRLKQENEHITDQ